MPVKVVRTSQLNLTFRQISGAQNLARRRGSNFSTNEQGLHCQRNARRNGYRDDNRQLFLDILDSSATRRDAKQYITRLKQDDRFNDATIQPHTARGLASWPQLSNEVPPTRDGPSDVATFPVSHDLHVTLICLKDPHLLDETVLYGITQTIVQLTKLGILPVIFLHIEDDTTLDTVARKTKLLYEANRLASTLIGHQVMAARPVSDPFGLDESDHLTIALPELLVRPILRKTIPILMGFSHDAMGQLMSLPLRAAMKALTSCLGQAVNNSPSPECSVSLDRIIVVDSVGGIPSHIREPEAHVYINLKQEFAEIAAELAHDWSAASDIERKALKRHLDNLCLLQACLETLPASTSALIISPEDAAATSKRSDAVIVTDARATKRPRNVLIHNLLTNKPLISPSLPVRQLRTRQRGQTRTTKFVTPGTTLVKRGMPLSIVPYPEPKIGWSLLNSMHRESSLQQNKHVDLVRLQCLLEDSFGRALNMPHYLKRVDAHIAGILIAGHYEGAAIMTWEQPPGTDCSTRAIPYLDKFAVLKSSQGSSGVADILFQALVRTCLPRGVCWRSRNGNPVNKWYFERASGFWRIPGTQWTMFWTGSEAASKQTRFNDYVSVCRSIETSFEN